MAEIIVTVKKDGTTSVAVKDVKGADCKALTRQLEDALGVVTDDQSTPEMFEEQSGEQSHYSR
jgi:Protein of unknown function (DUF2997)